MALFEGWHAENHRKPSTQESYKGALAKLSAYLGHDDAARVTRADILGFKDSRLASGVLPKTVRDSDLAALKVIFGWAVANDKLRTNPAAGVTLKVGKRPQRRTRDLTPDEAKATLRAALAYRRHPKEDAKTAAAKHWVPWLLAYTGARVGEMAQLRKQDVRREEGHWIIAIDLDAGTVKTDEARKVVIHEHLIELGFVEFVDQAPDGHLFLKVTPGGDVRGRLRGLKNRLQKFAREFVTDPHVAPNHGWRHRFKTVGMEAGISSRVLDAIQGHAPSNVGDTYGHVTIPTMADAMHKFPRIEI